MERPPDKSHSQYHRPSNDNERGTKRHSEKITHKSYDGGEKSESWIHIHTNGSAKDAVKYGGAGVHIIFSNVKPKMKPYQQASTVLTTEQKLTQLLMQHTPTETEEMKTPKLSS